MSGPRDYWQCFFDVMAHSRGLSWVMGLVLGADLLALLAWVGGHVESVFPLVFGCMVIGCWAPFGFAAVAWCEDQRASDGEV